tara:strand:- start:3748 stop:3930 length:183 start_codon:yes stop_codon:yes gene_type:complete
MITTEVLKQRIELARANKKTIEAYEELEKKRKRIEELEEELDQTLLKLNNVIQINYKLKN